MEKSFNFIFLFLFSPVDPNEEFFHFLRGGVDAKFN